jgi:hypothetical protein
MNAAHRADGPQMIHVFNVQGRVSAFGGLFEIKHEALLAKDARAEALRQYPEAVIHGMTIESSRIYSADGIFVVHGRWRRKHMAVLVPAEGGGDALAAVHEQHKHIIVTGAVPATEEDLAALSLEPTEVVHKFFHWNDCSPVPLVPATHWMWQFGNSWRAVANEGAMSWFDNELPEELVRKFLVHDITDVPVDATLIFWDAEGNDHEVDANTFAPTGA